MVRVGISGTQTDSVFKTESVLLRYRGTSCGKARAYLILANTLPSLSKRQKSPVK